MRDNRNPVASSSLSLGEEYFPLAPEAEGLARRINGVLTHFTRCFTAAQNEFTVAQTLINIGASSEALEQRVGVLSRTIYSLSREVNEASKLGRELYQDRGLVDSINNFEAADRFLSQENLSNRIETEVRKEMLKEFEEIRWEFKRICSYRLVILETIPKIEDVSFKLVSADDGLSRKYCGAPGIFAQLTTQPLPWQEISDPEAVISQSLTALRRQVLDVLDSPFKLKVYSDVGVRFDAWYEKFRPWKEMIDRDVQQATVH